MLRFMLAALAVTMLPLGAIHAQTAEDARASSPDFGSAGRSGLGRGGLFNNDILGDNGDRWRSASLSLSRVWGRGWNGAAPARLGDLIELRFQAQIISPENLSVVDPSDRPYAGILGLGLHSHAARAGFDYSLGVDVVAIGPQTHMDDLQDALHSLFDAELPSPEVLAHQIANTIRPTAVAELGRTYEFPGASLRPFLEARAGDEMLVRIGADLTLGLIGRGELLVRDSVSGQRYRVIQSAQPGWSVTLGGDVAYVAESVYLPESLGYEVKHRRDRFRAGLHWQGRKASAFYGLSYLGREFERQREGQLIGSAQIRARF